MQTTRVSSKGQVTIPKGLRDARHWGSGTRLEVQGTPEGVLLKPVAVPDRNKLASGLAAIRARVGHQGRAVTLQEMDAAVPSGSEQRGVGAELSRGRIVRGRAQNA